MGHSVYACPFPLYACVFLPARPLTVQEGVKVYGTCSKYIQYIDICISTHTHSHTTYSRLDGGRSHQPPHNPQFISNPETVQNSTQRTVKQQFLYTECTVISNKKRLNSHSYKLVVQNLWFCRTAVFNQWACWTSNQFFSTKH